MRTSRRGRRGWFPAALLIAFGAALALRLPRLDQKPMHGDEANQAVRAGILLDTGAYHYDPNDHHGPTLYFAALPFCRATARTFADTTEWNFRLVPVAFSLLTLLLMAGLGDAVFRNRADLCAALLLTAVSPAMVYYNRFFIQESMLVAFLTGMLWCAVKYAGIVGGRRSEVGGRRPEVGGRRPEVTGSAGQSGARAPSPAIWAAGFGAFAGLAAATKETAVLSFAAAAVAALAACGPRRLLRAWNTRHALIALGAAALVAALLFSSFFTYPRGVYDALFSTFSTYTHRATAVPEHQHPWNFYLKILFWFKYGKGPVWSEAGLLIPAAVAVVAAFFMRRRGAAEKDGERSTFNAQRSTLNVQRSTPNVWTLWVRFMAVYTLALTALYSAIPYKTPWCALSFLHGFILLAGAGVGMLWDWISRGDAETRRGPASFAPLRLCGRILLALSVAALAWRHSTQACRACFKLPADPRNPYVYAHTGTDAMNLVAEIERAAQRIDGYDTLIALAVPTPDTWPLPWYLRKYKNVGYWTSVADIPADIRPAIVVAAADQGDLADERFGQGKRASFFGIRPGVLLNLFVPGG